MYHFDPAVALEELRDDAILPNPVHMRDMLLRAHLAPENALELNRLLQEYMKSFASAQRTAGEILEALSPSERP